MTTTDVHPVARQLQEWFDSILHFTEQVLFSIAPEGPHRDAVVLDTLKRNARILTQAESDNEGKLYGPLCFFLAAACRKLGTSLTVGHWQTATRNVIELQHRLMATGEESYTVGLDIGSPAVIFKREFDEAIHQSGLVTGTSFLSKQDREVALGLAINWGMRFLISYALECSRPKISNRKDLAWVGSVVKALVADSGTAEYP